MGYKTSAAVFNAFFVLVSEFSATFFAEGVKGAVAEKTAEGLRISPFMTGEIFTFFVLKKIIITHAFILP